MFKNDTQNDYYKARAILNDAQLIVDGLKKVKTILNDAELVINGNEFYIKTDVFKIYIINDLFRTEIIHPLFNIKSKNDSENILESISIALKDVQIYINEINKMSKNLKKTINYFNVLNILVE